MEDAESAIGAVEAGGEQQQRPEGASLREARGQRRQRREPERAAGESERFRRPGEAESRDETIDEPREDAEFRLAVEAEHDVAADALRIEIGEAAAHIDHGVMLEAVIGPQQQEDRRAGGERREGDEGDSRRLRSRRCRGGRLDRSR